MGKKRDREYFESFVKIASLACDAAEYLNESLENFSQDELKERLVKMHEIEHKGDTKRHEIMNLLSKEFITPIEREDIASLLEELDNVIDKIEDVLLRLYMFNIKEIREDAKKMSKVILKCTNSVKECLSEFTHFRKSKILIDKIVEVNRLEEEADVIYQTAVRNLFTEEKDPIKVASWNQTFHYLEGCCDACEDVSDILEGIIMKNT